MPPNPPAPEPGPAAPRTRGPFRPRLPFRGGALPARWYTGCAWCGTPVRRRVADLLGRRPGTAECPACTYRFGSLPPPFGQPEPRRSAAAAGPVAGAGVVGSGSGAARGFGGPPAAAVASGALEPGCVLRSRARALLPYAEPESWLDIESGAARFPRTARELLPYTAFDALGATGVEEALAAGRIDAGLPGTLRALAPRIPGHYDALSMFHRLQHSAEAGAELRAARTVLRPGGHLVLDCANPASWSGRLLARRGAAATGRDPRAVRPLLLTSAELETELARLGFTVLGTGSRGAHIPCELTAAVTRLVPGGRGPGAPGRRVPALLGALCLPLLAAARLLDHLLALALRGPRLANSYRIVARREPDAAVDPAAPVDAPEPTTPGL